VFHVNFNKELFLKYDNTHIPHTAMNIAKRKRREKEEIEKDFSFLIETELGCDWWIIIIIPFRCVFTFLVVSSSVLAFKYFFLDIILIFFGRLILFDDFLSSNSNLSQTNWRTWTPKTLTSHQTIPEKIFGWNLCWMIENDDQRDFKCVKIKPTQDIWIFCDWSYLQINYRSQR